MRKVWLLSLPALIFILLTTFLTVYQVRQKQIYEGKAAAVVIVKPQKMYVCARGSACAPTALEFKTTGACVQWLRTYYPANPGNCYLTEDDCKAHCSVAPAATGANNNSLCKLSISTAVSYGGSAQVGNNIWDVSKGPVSLALSISSLPSGFDQVRFRIKGNYNVGACWTAPGGGCSRTPIPGLDLRYPYTDPTICGQYCRMITPGSASATYDVTVELHNASTGEWVVGCSGSFEIIFDPARHSALGTTPTPTPGGSPTPTPTMNPKADINSDSCVNSIDLGILIDNYNPTAPSCQ